MRRQRRYSDLGVVFGVPPLLVVCSFETDWSSLCLCCFMFHTDSSLADDQATQQLLVAYYYYYYYCCYY